MSAPRAVAALSALGLLAASSAASAHTGNSTSLPFLEARTGFSYANVFAFDNSGLLPGVNESRVWGPHLGATLGLRFGPVAFGARVDWSRFEPFNLGTAGGVVQLRLPIPVVQPWARVGFGYAWLGDVSMSSSLVRCSPTSTSTQCPSVRGWTLSGGAGVDFLLGRYLTLGAGLELYVLNLTRSASPTSVNLQQTGDSLGLQLTGTVQLGLHI